MLYIVVAIVFAVAILSMAVGVILGRSRIRGSCGGLANLRDSEGHVMCDACSHPSPDCSGDPEEEAEREAAAH